MPGVLEGEHLEPDSELRDPAGLERADDHRALPADLGVEERIGHRERHLVAQLGRPDRVRDDQDVGHGPDPSPPRASAARLPRAALRTPTIAAVTPGCSSTQATAWRRSVRPRAAASRACAGDLVGSLGERRGAAEVVRLERLGREAVDEEAAGERRPAEQADPVAADRLEHVRVPRPLEQAQRLLARRHRRDGVRALDELRRGGSRARPSGSSPPRAAAAARPTTPRSASSGRGRGSGAGRRGRRRAAAGSPRGRRGSPPAGCPSARPVRRRARCRTW